jgi:hypothetical protein
MGTAKKQAFHPDLHWDSYRRFAEAAFGAGSYQATRGYLRWLYEDCPWSRGYEDMVFFADDDGEVAAVAHKMRLPWKFGAEEVAVPAVHNLYVAEKYRSGLGFLAVMTAFSGEERALIPGAAPPFSAMYPKIKCQEIPGMWYRRVVAPVRAGFHLFGHAVSGKSYTGTLERKADTEIVDGASRWAVTLEPTAKQIADAAAALRDTDSEGSGHPVWNEATLYWRFLHPRAPRHAFVCDGDKPGRNFAMVCLGPRKGLAVGRVVLFEAEDAAATRGLLRACRRLIHRCGGDAMLIFSADDRQNRFLQAAGWMPFAGAPKTFLFNKKRTDQLACQFGGAAGDYGFEAMASGE